MPKGATRKLFISNTNQFLEHLSSATHVTILKYGAVVRRPVHTNQHHNGLDIKEMNAKTLELKNVTIQIVVVVETVHILTHAKKKHELNGNICIVHTRWSSWSPPKRAACEVRHGYYMYAPHQSAQLVK